MHTHVTNGYPPHPLHPLSFLCSSMHTRTGRPTQWCGEGGLARHSLKGLLSCVG